MLNGLFTTPVYLRRRSRFVNSAFPNKKLWPKNRSLFMTNKFENKSLQKSYISGKQEKDATGRRHLTSSNQAAIFVSTWTWQGNRKQQKLSFSSQVRKQFKLSTVPFKPLRCCLQRDKLVNCHIWKFCKDLFLNFCVIWSVNQIVLFNGFLSDTVEITSCVYTKTIIIPFNMGE